MQNLNDILTHFVPNDICLGMQKHVTVSSYQWGVYLWHKELCSSADRLKNLNVWLRYSPKHIIEIYHENAFCLQDSVSL